MEVVEYDWGADAHNLLAGRNGGVPAGYDVVMCADCVYARASVEPLLESLLQVWANCRHWVETAGSRETMLQ